MHSSCGAIGESWEFMKMDEWSMLEQISARISLAKKHVVLCEVVDTVRKKGAVEKI